MLSLLKKGRYDIYHLAVFPPIQIREHVVVLNTRKGTHGHLAFRQRDDSKIVTLFLP